MGVRRAYDGILAYQINRVARFFKRHPAPRGILFFRFPSYPV